MKIPVRAVVALLLATVCGCSISSPQHVSPTELSERREDFVGTNVVVNGCIVWGRHGAAILSCDRTSERRGIGLLDPQDLLAEAFGATGALPFGGEIRAEVHGVIVVDEDHPMVPTDDGLDTFLTVKKIFSPRLSGP